MEYEKRHIAYRPTIGGRSVSADKLINDLGKDSLYYIGTYSEYNPIGFNSGICAIVHKQTTPNNCIPQKDFHLEGYKQKSAGGYHGSDFNNNGGLKFTKQDLLRIANAMDDTDHLSITFPDSLDKEKFIENIKIVTK